MMINRKPVKGRAFAAEVDPRAKPGALTRDGNTRLSTAETDPQTKPGAPAAAPAAVEKRAIYPGSFDPITNGHIDIILRGEKLFPRILIAVLENPKKETLFTTSERIEMIREIFKGHSGVEVKAFHGLLVEFARKNHARIVIRGLRVVSDFEYEFQMALMNKNLNSQIETFFVMPSAKYAFLSSSLVKEAYALGGRLDDLVPDVVEKRLYEKFRKT